MSTKAVDLDRLLVATANHDAGAFQQLYDLASPKLFATVLRIVRNRPVAEEVLQDVFLRIWQNAASFSPESGPARVWMTAIARNRAIDLLRHKTPVPVSDLGERSDWFERVPEDRDREEDMIAVASLRRCLGQLEAQARDCVLLAYYEGLSRDELAQRFGRPVNTIKTWLHRSLAALRVCLDGGGA